MVRYSAEDMANRSYLFATDLLPAPGVKPADGRMTGISEWNYDIPQAFRLLLTGNPRKTTSSIWDVPEQIAIVGDYDAGVSRLLAELKNHSGAEVAELRDDAGVFLSDPKNRRKYLVLECGEIFEMDDEPLEEQNDKLLNEIQSLCDGPGNQAEAKPVGFLSRLFGGGLGAKRIDWSAFGLGNWSNVLYYEPWASDGESAAE